MLQEDEVEGKYKEREDFVRIEAGLGHGDGPGGRQQHLSTLALEGNEGDLVPALVGLGEQTARSACQRE